MIWAVLLATVAAWPANMPVAEKDRVQKIWDQMVWELYRKTDVYWHQGKYDHLMRVGYMWVQADPANLEAYTTTSFVLANGMRNYGAAEKVYRQAVSMRPNDWRAYHELVFFLYWRERFKEAVVPGEHMLSLGPLVTAYHLVANCYEKAGDLPKSIATWKRAISKDPMDDVAKRRLKEVQNLAAGKKAEG